MGCLRCSIKKQIIEIITFQVVADFIIRQNQSPTVGKPLRILLVPFSRILKRDAG